VASEVYKGYKIRVMRSRIDSDKWVGRIGQILVVGSSSDSEEECIARVKAHIDQKEKQ